MTQTTQKSPAWLKPVVEFGPLAVFFVTYTLVDLLIATAVLMAATAVALAVWWLVERSVPKMPLVSAILVGVFGGLTLWLNDETFIKMKPTIVQALFSVVLLGGLLFRRPLLKFLFAAAWTLDEAGWRKLTLRFGLFFAAMAVLNEVVWRTQSTDFWVAFKVFGIMTLTAVFAASQVFLLREHSPPELDAADEN